MTKPEKYLLVIKQIKAVVLDEKDLIANLANISAILKTTFDWWWVGFYFVKDKELVVGPFQGPVACTRIAFGKGVCGSTWQKGESMIVHNVHDFPGHIACSADSLSEIVVPIFKDEKVEMVLDVDSEKEAHFDKADQKYLEEICQFISTII